MIDDHAALTLHSDEFKTLKRETVEKIISRDTLDVKEVDVWLGCLAWAEEECKRQNKQVMQHF